MATSTGSRARRRPKTPRCSGCNRDRLGTFVRDGPDGSLPKIRLGFCCISALLAVEDPYRLAAMKMVATGQRG